MHRSGDSVVELDILGPLVLRVDGEEVSLGPTLSVLTLALLCAQGVFVSSARLGGLLAELGKGPTTEQTVRSHVSHLRKAFNDSPRRGQETKVLMSGRAGGTIAYALRPEAINTDAQRFVQKVDEGLAELHEGSYVAAAGLFRTALALWRGDPLCDAAGRPFARDWTEHLQDLRRQAMTARVGADVGAGHYAKVVTEFAQMARDWPDDENVSALLVIVRYRCGQSRGAAAAARDAIRAAQAHGMDSPRLHALQRDVLNGTLPGTGLPHTVWAH
jgi:DNA-binding SARP family transcriptional activator